MEDLGVGNKFFKHLSRITFDFNVSKLSEEEHFLYIKRIVIKLLEFSQYLFAVNKISISYDYGYFSKKEIIINDFKGIEDVIHQLYFIKNKDKFSINIFSDFANFKFDIIFDPFIIYFFKN